MFLKNGPLIHPIQHTTGTIISGIKPAIYFAVLIIVICNINHIQCYFDAILLHHQIDNRWQKRYTTIQKLN
jgi:hypothetical protein